MQPSRDAVRPVVSGAEGARLRMRVLVVLIASAWVLLLFVSKAWPLLLVAAACAGATIILGTGLRKDRAIELGAVAGGTFVAVAIALAIVHLGVSAFLLVIVLVMAQWACAPIPSCDCGSGGCGDCGGCGCTAPLLGAMVPILTTRSIRPSSSRLRESLGHHPDTPLYSEDVFRVGGFRLCVGCFTVYPVFLIGAWVLFSLDPVVPSRILLLSGAFLASAQIVSSLGLSKRRPTKVLVKVLLGAGLALVTFGVVESPWSPTMQVFVLVLVMTLAMASAIPRALRIRRAAACDR